MYGQTLMQAFEKVALEFYEDTGIIAPGKNVPAAMDNCPQTDIMYRQGAWDCWNRLHEKNRIISLKTDVVYD